jgi:hypothetical protein
LSGWWGGCISRWVGKAKRLILFIFLFIIIFILRLTIHGSSGLAAGIEATNERSETGLMMMKMKMMRKRSDAPLMAQRVLEVPSVS